MPSQERRQRGATGRSAQERNTDSAEEARTTPAANMPGDLDDLLDEIDEVLEQNAEDFVKSYVQKGGE